MGFAPYILINGVDSRTITGLLITELPPISKPLQRTLVETIDGRDGDIVTPLGFSAYDKPCKIALTRGYDINDVIAFFNSEGLVMFSNEANKHYNFAIYDQIDFERLIRFKTATVNFHVQPFKYPLAEGYTIINPESFTLKNEGNIYSRPIFTFTGSGIVTLSINGVQLLTIDFGDTSKKIIIDCERMNAYYQDNTLANRVVIGNYDNIRLGVGNNTIAIGGSGSVTLLDVEKYSRWI